MDLVYFIGLNNYRAYLKKSGISKLLSIRVIALVLLSSQKNNVGLHKLEIIVVILSIIDFMCSKLCLRYEYDLLHKWSRYYECIFQ